MVYLWVALADDADHVARLLRLLHQFLTRVPAYEYWRHHTRKQYQIAYSQDRHLLWHIHIEQVLEIPVNVCYHLKSLVLILITHITFLP